MTKLSKREKTLLIILLIALCGALYYNFVLKTYLAKNEEINIKINDTRTALNDSKLKAASILLVDQKMKLINDEMASKFEKVLDSIDRPAIIVMMDKVLLPQATNISFGFSPAYQELKSNYITTVEVSFQCTQDGFFQILSKLRTAEYVNRVITSSLKISDPNTGVCEGSISVDVLTKSIIPTRTEFTYS